MPSLEDVEMLYRIRQQIEAQHRLSQQYANRGNRQLHNRAHNLLREMQRAEAELLARIGCDPSAGGAPDFRVE
jgi:hypothetical protein